VSDLVVYLLKLGLIYFLAKWINRHHQKPTKIK